MQEDAHECMRYILDGMQNEALRPYKREQLRKLRRQQKGDESATKPLMKQVHVPVEVEEKTWVHQLFGGHLSSCVHCTECGHDSVTTDPFLDLSLDIRQCNSVGDALNKFGRKTCWMVTTSTVAVGARSWCARTSTSASTDRRWCSHCT